ncbi:hypothetical protein A2774_01890 [Candidatus Roizmanbacteria bacterium RIFCSPHIGHO2_01_FULL_39_12c]|uniref:Putative 2'-deoxynucleoside 5'-phosphate N-hydrolase 1 n=1 Tax=Candidatus Roizmanbacteria bacterium RIFCSPHIGHO2_01_FULL_39_12c TaxID=1802031 RepID=A0A1F7G9P3_9BACT|nr:MAG: hypothetical protein A2774_01890 [Candidatus Roizmanbacteria bacterium RIFCSPHIGHO2_01_FULL_39_12c]
MKIYFAGSIRGGEGNKDLFKKIIDHLRKHGEVIGGEHADDVILSNLEGGPGDEHIYNRDSKRLNEADVLVAEVTTPSLGVGYEIGVATQQNKRILTLFKEDKDKKLSAMISGSPKITNKTYKSFEDIKKIIDEFFL